MLGITWLNKNFSHNWFPCLVNNKSKSLNFDLVASEQIEAIDLKPYTFQTTLLNMLFLLFNLQGKPKKEGPMSVEEAVEDSENLTDFLLDFEEEEWYSR